MTHMKMTLAALLLTLCLGPTLRADAPANALPEVLRPHAPLVDRCYRWHHRTGPMQWAHHNQESFDREHGNWRPALGGGSAHKVPGKDELLAKAPAGGPVFVPVGPAVRGPMAIEMVAHANQPAVPLGIILDQPRGKGPGFLFSTRPTTPTHMLWTDRQTDDGSFKSIAIGNKPELVIGQDYRIRLEIRDGQVRGYVDGKLVGRAPLSRDYDLTKLRQPMIMTSIATITVKSVTTEKLMPDTREQAKQMADQALWKELFGKATPQQIESRFDELVQLLDHDQWLVRENADNMIRSAGEFALPALRQAAKADSPELVMRAERLIRAIAPVPPPPPCRVKS